MTELFELLTEAVQGQYWIAVLAAGLWGVLSIVLSPCHLSSIPLVIGYISRQNKSSTTSTSFLSFIFASGVLFTISIIGIITAYMGRMIGDVGAWATWLVALLLISFGLYLLDIFKMDWMGGFTMKIDRAGSGGAFLLGLVFGIGLGPCTFAFLAPVLTTVFQVADESILKAIILILAFGVGHAGIIVLGGTLSTQFIRIKKWSDNSTIQSYIRRSVGVLLILSGIYFLLD